RRRGRAVDRQALLRRDQRHGRAEGSPRIRGRYHRQVRRHVGARQPHLLRFRPHRWRQQGDLVDGAGRLESEAADVLQLDDHHAGNLAGWYKACLHYLCEGKSWYIYSLPGDWTAVAFRQPKSVPERHTELHAGRQASPVRVHGERPVYEYLYGGPRRRESSARFDIAQNRG